MNEQSDNKDWIGKKPTRHVSLLITVATIACVVTVILYTIVSTYLGMGTPMGGVVMGIFSGLLTSGVITAAAWILYEYVSNVRHRAFRPHVAGRWFGYTTRDFRQHYEMEFVFIDQTAERVTGRITHSVGGTVYQFIGQVVLNGITVSWVAEEESVIGTLLLRSTDGKTWFGSQSYLHPESLPITTYYLMTRTPLSEHDWQLLGDLQEKSRQMEMEEIAAAVEEQNDADKINK